MSGEEWRHSRLYECSLDRERQEQIERLARIKYGCSMAGEAWRSHIPDEKPDSDLSAGQAWRSDLPDDAEAKPRTIRHMDYLLPIILGGILGALLDLAFISHRSIGTDEPEPHATLIYESEKTVIFKVKDGDCTIYVARGAYQKDGMSMQLGPGCK